MERTDKIAFITLASGKSKRLKNKHFINIEDKPLIKYTTDFVKYINLGFYEYYIITDDVKIKEFAEQEKIKVIMEPPHNNDRDHEHGMILMRWIHEQIQADMYFMFPATSPARDTVLINDFIFDCIGDEKLLSATTVAKKNRNEYIHNGSIWFFRKQQLLKDDLIDRNTRLYIDRNCLDIDTIEDIELFKRYIKENDEN